MRSPSVRVENIHHHRGDVVAVADHLHHRPAILNQRGEQSTQLRRMSGGMPLNACVSERKPKLMASMPSRYLELDVRRESDAGARTRAWRRRRLRSPCMVTIRHAPLHASTISLARSADGAIEPFRAVNAAKLWIEETDLQNECRGSGAQARSDPLPRDRALGFDRRRTRRAASIKTAPS